ncbi:MAG: hypothetical protein QNJ16_13655 [Rhodobacter sp.]|nr:hypothetical protein [Rhodobacter sp.]
MRAICLASAIAVWPAISCAAAECADPQAPYCVPFVGCVEATGEVFRGETYGARRGPLWATSSTGARCYGRWRRTLLGLGFGVATFRCQDGRIGRSTYTYFEKRSGTAVGNGTFGDGTRVRFWAGWNLEGYFASRAPDERARLACRPSEMVPG